MAQSLSVSMMEARDACEYCSEQLSRKHSVFQGNEDA